MTDATDTASDTRSTFYRPDTFFGVCEAIAQDFGFNPLWLRLAFVPPVFFQPAYALAAYLVLGLVVLASRLMFPDRRAAVDAAVVTETPAAVVPVTAPQQIDRHEPLPLAA
jgi:phage shock protein C